MLIITDGLCGGRPHIEGHRLDVQTIKDLYYNCDYTIFNISQDYEIPISDVLECLLYDNDVDLLNSDDLLLQLLIRRIIISKFNRIEEVQINREDVLYLMKLSGFIISFNFQNNVSNRTIFADLLRRSRIIENSSVLVDFIIESQDYLDPLYSQYTYDNIDSIVLK